MEGGPNQTAELGQIKVPKSGIVSRDYNHEYENGFRDFSETFSDILKQLDEKCCDTVLFSLYSIIPRKSFWPLRLLRLRNIKAVLYEEFKDGKKREIKGSVVLYREGNKWHRYPLPNWGFPNLRGSQKAKTEKVDKFKRLGMPGRVLGNCCAILCGEINSVPYHQHAKRVRDDFGLRRSLPTKVTVVLNPGHDRMSRFEMPLKRAFLSENDRWVISVWNRGKRDSGGRARDGTRYPWSVFHNGQDITEIVEPQHQIANVEIGILEIEGSRNSGAADLV